MSMNDTTNQAVRLVKVNSTTGPVWLNLGHIVKISFEPDWPRAAAGLEVWHTHIELGQGVAVRLPRMTLHDAQALIEELVS